MRSLRRPAVSPGLPCAAIDSTSELDLPSSDCLQPRKAETAQQAHPTMHPSRLLLVIDVHRLLLSQSWCAWVHCTLPFNSTQQHPSRPPRQALSTRLPRPPHQDRPPSEDRRELDRRAGCCCSWPPPVTCCRGCTPAGRACVGVALHPGFSAGQLVAWTCMHARQAKRASNHAPCMREGVIISGLPLLPPPGRRRREARAGARTSVGTPAR
jgi:hypothetical protein